MGNAEKMCFWDNREKKILIVENEKMVGQIIHLEILHTIIKEENKYTIENKK